MDLVYYIKLFKLWHKNPEKLKEQKTIESIPYYILDNIKKRVTKNVNVQILTSRRLNLPFALPLCLFPYNPEHFKLNMSGLNDRILVLLQDMEEYLNWPPSASFSDFYYTYSISNYR